MPGKAQDILRTMGELVESRIVEAFRPVEGCVWLVPLDAAKVVNDVAARDHHDVAVSKLRQLRSKLHVIVERLERIDRKLDDRNIGIGVQMSESAPRPMIQAPLVAIEPAPDRLDRFCNLLRNLRG